MAERPIVSEKAGSLPDLEVWPMSALTPRTPSYRHHKPSGQAVVTQDGRDIYLGRYGSPESRKWFQRLDRFGEACMDIYSCRRFVLARYDPHDGADYALAYYLLPD